MGEGEDLPALCRLNWPCDSPVGGVAGVSGVSPAGPGSHRCALAASVSSDGDGGGVRRGKGECGLVGHLDTGGCLAISLWDAAGIPEAVGMVGPEDWSSFNVRAVVDIVGPFGDRGVALGTVPGFGFSPPVVGAPGGIH